MTRKILSLLLACGMLSSCGIDYDGTTKIIFEGTVVDENGTPMANIGVSTSVTDGYYSDISGKAVTDSNGYYKMVTAGADEDVRYSIRLNTLPLTDFPPIVPSATYYNIIPGLIDDFHINFGETVVYSGNDPVIFSVTGNNASGSNLQIVKINVAGLVDGRSIDYNFNVPPEPDTLYNYDNQYFQNGYQVAKNQQLTVKYMLSDGSVHEEPVTIGTQDLTYTITY